MHFCNFKPALWLSFAQAKNYRTLHIVWNLFSFIIGSRYIPGGTWACNQSSNSSSATKIRKKGYPGVLEHKGGRAHMFHLLLRGNTTTLFTFLLVLH